MCPTGREYSLDPNFVRYPTPSLAGAASTPSTVDIYVNGQLIRTVLVRPGRFQIEDLPLTSGVGEVELVLRDLFGRDQRFPMPYYLSTAVLRRGEQDFGYGFGLQRLDQFDWPPSHDDPAVNAQHRVGLTDAVTLGYQVEADADVLTGGPVLSRVGVEIQRGSAVHYLQTPTGPG